MFLFIYVECVLVQNDIGIGSRVEHLGFRFWVLHFRFISER